MSNDAQQPATRAITAGRGHSGQSLAPALWASSVWQSADLADANRRATTLRSGEFYGRYANPTVASFEEAVATLEGAEASLAFASGMGAISTTILALCSAGDHIVAQRQLYSATLAFLQGPCARFGIDVTYVDGTKPGAFAAALRPGRTMLVIAETPSNPLLELVDLDELGALARADHAGRFDVRHTARPAAAGARCASVAAFGDEGNRRPQRRDARSDQRAARTARQHLVVQRVARRDRRRRSMHSTRCAAFARLAVRSNHQAASALHIAETLQQHPAVKAVHYPGLAHASAARSREATDAALRNGAGDRPCWRARSGRATAQHVCNSCESPPRSADQRRCCAIHARRRTSASPTPRPPSRASAPGCCACRSDWKIRPICSPISPTLLSAS